MTAQPQAEIPHTAQAGVFPDPLNLYGLYEKYTGPVLAALKAEGTIPNPTLDDARKFIKDAYVEAKRDIALRAVFFPAILTTASLAYVTLWSLRLMESGKSLIPGFTPETSFTLSFTSLCIAGLASILGVTLFRTLPEDTLLKNQGKMDAQGRFHARPNAPQHRLAAGFAMMRIEEFTKTPGL